MNKIIILLIATTIIYSCSNEKDAYRLASASRDLIGEKLNLIEKDINNTDTIIIESKNIIIRRFIIRLSNIVFSKTLLIIF